MGKILRVLVACVLPLVVVAVPAASGAGAAVCSATAYPAVIAADNPALWYQLNETSGTVAHDSSTSPHNGVYQGEVTFGVAGPTDCGAVPGVTLDGSSGYVSNANVITSPSTFSLDIWFKTTTTSGGMLIGFGNMVTGASTNYDRHIYMANSGQIYFGVSFNQTIHSAASYNNGAWHEAIATIGASGMFLYIDGALVASNTSITASAQTYTGSWRVGYDSLGGWSAHPTSNFFGGSVAEASVYNYQLTAAQAATHYLAATNPVSGLTITKTANVSTTVPGGTVKYTITAANTGQIPLTGASLTDSLTGVLDDASYNGNASASAGTVSYSSPSLTWTGNLAIGASATITYSVTVNDPETGDKILTNTVTSTTPGSNCPSGSTNPQCAVSTPVVTGVLSITAPASASVGSTGPGTTLTGQLGGYQVTDNRAAASANWTAVVSASNFTTGAGSRAQTIPAGDADYLISSLTTTGTATVRYAAATILSGTAQSIVAATGANGDNSATWKAALAVSVPASAVAGTYSGVITCSVS